MKKAFFTIIAAIIFALNLSSCNNAPMPPESLQQESFDNAAPAAPSDPAAPSADDRPPESDLAPERTAGSEYLKLTPQEAQEMMATYDIIMLDVRTQEEFDTGHLPDAILLPDYEISEKAGAVIPDKDQKILVYCRSGRRSESATKTLIGMGYTQVHDIGGIQSWTGEIIS